MDKDLKKAIISGVVGTLFIILIIIAISSLLSSTLNIPTIKLVFIIIVTWSIIISLIETRLLQRVYVKIKKLMELIKNEMDR